MTQLPQGFVPVMLTPFTDAGAIDFPALTHLTEFYLRAGAVGLFANCLSSEMFELTPDERLTVTRHVVGVADGLVPVVATGTFGGPLAEQAEFVREIHATGVAAVILIPNQLATPDEPDEVLTARTAELFALTDPVPLGLYECPVPDKRLVPDELLRTLLPTNRLRYLKDTSLDGPTVDRRLAIGAGYPFGLYDAYLVHAGRSLRAGALGLSCIQGNYVPELVAWFCRHATDPDRAADVAAVQQFFVDSMDILHTAYPTLAKHALRSRGVPMGTFTRRAVAAPSRAVLAELDGWMQRAEALRVAVGA